MRAARAFTKAALSESPADLTANAELIVTELVTNALLHGRSPVWLRILPEREGIRIEVQDAGASLPVRAQRRSDAMTGRGLELVAALVNDWGVEGRDPSGKTVWTRLSESPPDVPIASPGPRAPLGWKPTDPIEPRFRIRIGAVPTEFLLSAKAHIDNVVRELTLMQGEAHRTGVELPQPMIALIRAVTEEFAEARSEIKRQALVAAEHHKDVTDLALTLPLSAAAAGRRYLKALDEADRHARAARLLTLAPPRSHRAFRQWYVEAVIEQLRAVASGRRAPATLPFSQVLAAEIDRLSILEESRQQLQLLQRISTELTGAASLDAIAAIVARNAVSYPGVVSAEVFVVTGSGILQSLGRCDTSWPTDRLAKFSVDEHLLAASVARSGEPLFLRSVKRIDSDFPEFVGYDADDRSLHMTPLVIQRQLLGVLSLTFLGGELADETQRNFVRIIADALAQAIKRTQAMERTESERQRDLHLMSAQIDVLTEIVAERSLSESLESLLLAIEAVSTDGMLASVLLLDSDGRHLRHCAAPSLPDSYNEAIDGLPIGPSSGSCGTAAYRRRQVIVEDIRTDPRWAQFREIADAAGLRACWSTPIVGGQRQLLGTFAMYYPQPQRPSSADQELIKVLVRTVAMAIERKQVDEERARAFNAERQAALTLQHSLLPSVPAAVGTVRLEARYRAGDPHVQVGGDWFDAIAPLAGATLIVGDVQGHDLQAAALMGQLRTVGRTSADRGESPAQILQSLNDYLEQIGTELLTTAVVVHLDDAASVATVASAGHLPPMMIAPGRDGRWRVSDLPMRVTPPLGLTGERNELATPLPPAGFLLLYTDGLVESRDWPLDRGLELLQERLQALPRDVTLTDLLDAVIELLPSGTRDDDVAVLAAALPA